MGESLIVQVIKHGAAMDKPILTKISETQGIDEAIIVIKGYLSDNTDSEEVFDDYVGRLRNAGWQGSIYHLWWDASNEGGLVQSVSSAPLLGVVGAGMPPIIVVGLLGARWHWAKVKDRAKRTGRDHALSLIKSEITESKVSLLGHSLGARVAYYLMRTAVCESFTFENVYLLGGAVRRDSSKEWGYVAGAVSGSLVNVHNKKDKILSKFYRAAELRQNPCGRKPIKREHVKIDNVDARYIINSSSHGAYRKHLRATIGAYFHR